jgi:hypothetical protein
MSSIELATYKVKQNPSNVQHKDLDYRQDQHTRQHYNRTRKKQDIREYRNAFICRSAETLHQSKYYHVSTSFLLMRQFTTLSGNGTSNISHSLGKQSSQTEHNFFGEGTDVCP